MPEISRFLGIVIYMYFNDHNPPHFHVKYGEYRASFTVEPIALLEGSVPPRVLSLIIEWAAIHQEALMHNWQTIKATGAYSSIAPLV